MKIISVGHASYDITMPLDTYPIENTKNRVHDMVECGGGPASNAAYLLGKWGMETYFAGIVGDDLYGKRIKDEFKNVNVNTKYLEVSKDHITSTAFIIVNKEKGSRTVLTYRPSDMHMSKIVLDFTPDVILVDGQEYDVSVDLLKKYPNAISIIDAGRDRKDIIELAKMVKYLVCSKEFAEKVTGITIDYNKTNTISKLYNKMEEIFKNTVVVTLESKGCLYKKDGKIKIMPSIRVKPVDSTGAGDIFHGAFTYYIANDFELEKALKLSNIAGAISVTRTGGRFSMPTKEEMDTVYNEFK